VITTVDRDELPDQGAAHFAAIVREVKRVNPNVLVETLAGDFRGEVLLTKTLIESGLDVYSHNIETTERLTSQVRDRRAGYQQSLGVLRSVKELRPNLVTKSSIMLGLGEERDEVLKTMQDVRDTGAEIFTLGQYLRPTRRHLAVERYVTPEEFRSYEQEGLAMGFAFVASGPLVRSSYRAGEYFIEAFLKERKIVAEG
jgi:lipoic acid synthetase